MPGYIVPALKLEGDYSAYTLKWKTALDAGESIRNILVRADETLDKLFLRNPYNSKTTIRKLSDGTFESVTDILSYFEQYYGQIYSVLRKYFAYVVVEAAVPKLKIYKAGSLIQTINLSESPISWTNTSTDYIVTFSPDGKYIFVDNTNVSEYALFEGS